MRKRPMSRDHISSLGGKARAKKLSAKRRTQIARQAAQARWSVHRQAVKLAAIRRLDGSVPNHKIGQCPIGLARLDHPHPQGGLTP